MPTRAPHAVAGFALALRLALGAAPAAAAPSSPAPLALLPFAALPAEARAFVKLANQHRVALGLKPLAWDERAAAVAQAHSVDMAARGYFGHDDPDGRTPFDRLDAGGIGWSVAAENLAAGYATGRAVFDAWMRSPGHRADLEDPRLARHGLGFYHGRWTHVFYTAPAP